MSQSRDFKFLWHIIFLKIKVTWAYSQMPLSSNEISPRCCLNYEYQSALNPLYRGMTLSLKKRERFPLKAESPSHVHKIYREKYDQLKTPEQELSRKFFGLYVSCSLYNILLGNVSLLQSRIFYIYGWVYYNLLFAEDGTWESTQGKYINEVNPL